MAVISLFSSAVRNCPGDAPSWPARARNQTDAALIRAARASYTFAVDGDYFIGRRAAESAYPANETGFELQRIKRREYPTERIA